MNSKLLFLLGCIPVRLALVFLVYKLSSDKLRYVSIPFFMIGLSFLYLYFSNSRLQAPEAGGVTWWKNLRPVHGTLYLLTGYYCLIGHGKVAAILLLIDLIVGLSAFIKHHYIN